MRLGRAVNGLLPEASVFRLATKALLLGIVIALLAAAPAWATDFHGQVVFGGLPVPGAQATVTATQGDKTVTAVTDDQGLFAFTDLADGAWNITITMTGFAPIKEPITVAPNSPIPVFELKLQTLAEIRDEDKPVKVEPGAAPAATAAATSPAANATAKGNAPANGKGKNGSANQAQTAGNNAPPEAPPAQEASSAPSPDGFLINGSVNNAATSQFSLNQAFGTARNSRSLYNAQFALNFSSSALNANSYSLLGPTTKPNFNNYTAQFQFAGPLKIPHLLPLYRAPNFTIAYGRSDNTSVSVPTALMPTTDLIGGNLSALTAITGQVVYVPATGLQPGCTATPGSAFPSNSQGQYIPSSCISPIAQNILNKLYPIVPSTTPIVSGYNYQVPLSTDSHSDFGRVSLSKGFGNKNNLNGNYSLQTTRESSPNLFGFVDKQANLGQSMNVSWYHRFTQRLSTSTSYSFSRQRSDTTIFFQSKKENLSNEVGVNGNLQDAANYGPPGLSFSTSRFSGLSDGNSQNDRNQTQNITVNANWNRFRHEVQFGGDFRRQEWNYFRQSNPRGSIGFTGVATESPSGSGGLDYADFLLGLPDTSQIAYGNADKYLRETVYDLNVRDNFRVSPELTVNAGLRYDYSGPVTETKNRLVNLDFAPNFTQQALVLGTSPKGTLSNQQYPKSLMRPDRAGFAPSVAIAWRPISGSSLLVRSGYGLYHDSSVYEQMALAMANQTPGLGAPWSSISESISGSSLCPLALGNPFIPLGCAITHSATDTFAVDPNFRVGYLHAWNLELDRDLPASMQVTVVYNGSKGARGVQEILPNTYPVPSTTANITAADPCPSCPKGFAYRMSNGNSTYEGAYIRLRRRLRAGFQASATYTFSKSLDDDYSYGGGSGPVFGSSSSGGSSAVAQDWRHPEAQRGLSTFDQRHKLAVQMQYTTGMGLGGHALLSGWRGAIYKEWTVLTNISVGSGLPETIVDPVQVPGSAYTNIIRADYNGGAVHQQPSGGSLNYLNQSAFTGPKDHFGTSPRDFVIGPSQFSMSGSMQRTFRLDKRISMDARIDANNVLNHVAYSQWNNVLPNPTSSASTTNSQFGTPMGFNQMRSVSINLRLRY